MDDPNTYYTPLRMTRPFSPGAGGGGGGGGSNPTFVQSNAVNGTTAALACPFLSNVAAGSLIVVTAATETWGQSAPVAGDLTTTGVTVNNKTLDITDQFTTFADERMVVIYSGIAASAGALTMTFNSAGVRDLQMTVSEYSGNWSSSKLEATNTGRSTVDTPGSNPVITGSSASVGGAVFVGACEHYNDSTVTVDGAFTEYAVNTMTRVHRAIYRIVGSGTTDAAQWNVTGIVQFYWWVAAMAVYKQG